MSDAGDRDDAHTGEKDKEHDRRNQNQLELLRLAYERKRHGDYIDEMRRRTQKTPRDQKTSPERTRGGEDQDADPFA